MAATRSENRSDLPPHTPSQSERWHYRVAQSPVAPARKYHKRDTSERQKILRRELRALRKLHEYLKPRTHLLLEPGKKYFEPFVKPLLEIPGSTYRHSFLDPYDWQSYQRIFDLGLIKPEKSSVDPSQLGQLNDSLLLVGNFAEVLRKPVFGFGLPAQMAIHQFCMAAVRAHQHVHAYGPVRILLWIPDEDRNTIVPQDIGQRGHLAYGVERCGSATIVASSGKLSMNEGFHGIEMRHTQRVVKTMDRNGMKSPPKRQTLEYQQACDYLAHEGEVPTPEENPLSRRWEGDKEIGQLEMAFSPDEIEKDRQSARAKFLKKGKKESEIRFLSDDPRLERLYRLRHHRRSMENLGKKLNGLAALDEELVQLELAIAAEDLSDNDKENLTMKMQAKLAELKAKQSRLGAAQQTRLSSVIDNLLARNRESSLLSWDRRAFEPLQMTKHEVYPPEHLALLDFQPKPPLSFPSKNQSDEEKLEAMFISKLFVTPGQTLRKALETCAPGAADALIPQAPSVTDPTRGGRLDVDLLRVRLLTLEMVDELLKAWMDWPFRPTLDEMRRTGRCRKGRG
ncbi:MAG: hypothetical protein Q9165_001472 [Trypethelium subeluteriae]